VRILSRTTDTELREQLEQIARRLKAELVHEPESAAPDSAAPAAAGSAGEAGAAGDEAGSAREAGSAGDEASSAGDEAGAAGPAPDTGDATDVRAGEGGSPAEGGKPDVLVVEMPEGGCLDDPSEEAKRRGAALLVACRRMEDCDVAALSHAHDWILLPTEADEIETRLATARQRALRSAMEAGAKEEDVAEFLRYEELLYDRLTGFPTLPVMLDRARDLFDRQGEVTILYIQFVWYEKIEEIYGWQKLDDVLESTATGVKDFYRQHHPESENLMMVSHIGDDDFILFTEQPRMRDTQEPERALKELTQQLESFLRDRLEADHSEDIASLCGIYVGASTVFRNPKIRMERLIYRGIREASQAARGAKEWERSRKISDLKTLLREGAVFMEYHPIIVTDSEEIYGYEALARGRRPGLRSPEVLLDVASEANLLWELSRLLRKRAVEGISGELDRGQYLFLNVDPHDFNDPSFLDITPESLGVEHPDRIVLEITERTAIRDYPQFQEHLATFRERGFRFAVDDAGSGYAGLGSIANLDPDFIKLDISLISNIDTNFMKQNLVETLVRFAEDHGAKVVAEGVERREEFTAVRDIGVHLTQGFLFHKPRLAGLES
jgi:EAL domain-containing protein (putative c-di-GMP-specific phosphodiesterase class I)